MKVIIIGGVAGGASAATRLRRLDENAEIIMFERDEYVSYANCGLPYYIGGVISDEESLTVETPKKLKDKFNLDVRTCQEVISIDRDSKIVNVKKLEDGSVYQESYDKLILSPGAESVKPPIQGMDLAEVFTLRNIPDTFRIKEFVDTNHPKRAVVIGAGFIGIETAENLHLSGLDVTVVDMADHILTLLDGDMAYEAEHYLMEKGLHLQLSNGVKSIEKTGAELTVHLDQGDISTDMVIMSVGIRPDSKLAKDCGLPVNPKGAILIDDHMRTEDPDIYAIGSATLPKNFITGEDHYISLAGPANKQGRIAADNICGLDAIYNGTQCTSIVKLYDMTVAATGLSEKAAKDAGLDYDKIYLWPSDHATYYPGFTNMTIKVVFENVTGRILGAQLVGFDGVANRCNVFATAIRARMTAHDLAELELCYAPPYSSAKDPVNMAGFAIENILAGRLKQVFCEDLEELQKNPDLQIVDVRPIDFYMDGFIPGAKSMPLAQIRRRLKKLDINKPVLLYCNMGLNSYNAYRFLVQNGYDCVSLSGGYHMYASTILKNETVEPAKFACGAPQK